MLRQGERRMVGTQVSLPYVSAPIPGSRGIDLERLTVLPNHRAPGYFPARERAPRGRFALK